MNQKIAELLDHLENVPHCADEYYLTNLLRDWRGILDLHTVRLAVSQWLSEPAVIEPLRRAARETTTHYVWPLYSCGNGFSLVLNEYKDPLHRVMGYATTLHNHRYSFASLVLSGGYGQVLSTVDIPKFGQKGEIHVTGSDDISRGDIVTVNHQEFHRLTYIDRGTVTMLAKCPAAKESSISVDISTMKVSRHIPVEARFEELLSSLLMTKDTETAEDESRAGLA